MHASGAELAEYALDFMAPSMAEFGFAAGVFSAVAMNSAWQISARDSNVGRRRIELPNMYDPNIKDQKVDIDLLNEAKADLLSGSFGVTRYGNRLARGASKRSIEDARKSAGKFFGEGALKIACATIPYSSPTTIQDYEELQELAFESSMTVVDTSKMLANQLGVVPTFAQLANDNSPLVSFIMENAPSQNFYNIMDNALGNFAQPR